MKIVIATTTSFHLASIARELQKLGHEVTYISYYPTGRIKKDGVTKFISLFIPLLPYSFFALFRWLPALQKKYLEKIFDLTDNKIIKVIPECDVFIGLSCMSIKSAKYAKDTFNAKIFIERGSRHVLSQNELMKSEAKPRPLSKLYIERELASYKVADVICLPSIHSYQSFLDEDFESKQLFHNNYGVNLERFPSNKIKNTQGKFNIGLVGAFSYRKGADLLIEAINKIPNVTLLHAGIIGDIAFPTGNDKFKSLGHVNNANLAQEFYSKCDVIVLPSREDGFGMVLLEALACGVPIVASTMTGGPDVYKVLENKRAVEIFETENLNGLTIALFNSLNFVSENAGLTVMSQADREYFSWGAYGLRYEKKLNELVGLNYEN